MYSPMAEHCNIFVVPSLTMLFDDDGCMLNLGGCICTVTNKKHAANKLVSLLKSMNSKHSLMKLARVF